MSDKKQNILDALAKGDFEVEYWLPENVEEREVSGEGTIYVIDPSLGCDCVSGEDTVDCGGCTVTVCGIEFDAFFGDASGSGVEWQCEDEDLVVDFAVDEDIVEALEEHVRTFDEVGEDEVKEICALYAGKTRDELASRFYVLGFEDDLPYEDISCDADDFSGDGRVRDIRTGDIIEIDDEEFERIAALFPPMG